MIICPNNFKDTLARSTVHLGDELLFLTLASFMYQLRVLDSKTRMIDLMPPQEEALSFCVAVLGAWT